MPIDVLLYGAGGHGKVVLDAIQKLNINAAIADDDSNKKGCALLGVKIQLMENIQRNIIDRIHIAIGDNVTRKVIADRLLVDGWQLETIIHPLAVKSEHSVIESGVFLAASVIVGPESHIGRCTIINHSAVIDHDCIIGDFCHIAPNSTLGGSVILGNGVLIGSGAVILPGVHVGDGAKVGAGAVVTHDVGRSKVVVGVPAVEK
jgi:sugar O-acyltransferase (sialic acid O-acetyltransferase NeuD family)